MRGCAAEFHAVSNYSSALVRGCAAEFHAVSNYSSALMRVSDRVPRGVEL